jgi:hypothetical protein
MPYLYKKEYTELFHSYLVDSRKSSIDKSKISVFENQKSTDLRLFCCDLEDPRRTNMESACCVPDDGAFIMTGFKIEAKFSSHTIVADFIRSTRFTIIVGDKPMYVMEANVLADSSMTEGFTLPGGVTRGVTIDTADLNTDLVAKQGLERSIAIPPRQCIEVVMSTSGMVAEHMRSVESGTRKEFVEIRLSLCGDRHIRLKEKKPDYYPNEDGMPLPGDQVHATIVAMPADDTTSDPYRGYGEPKDESALDKLSQTLMFHLKVLTHEGQQWSPEIVKQALMLAMDAFPEHKDEYAFFTIPPEDTTEESGGPDATLVYGFPFSKVEKEFFDDPEKPKAWNPADYLAKKLKS